LEWQLKSPTARVEEISIVAGRESTFPTIPKSHAVFNSQSIITLLDSGASDHCFTERELFTTYRLINPPRTGQSAGKDSTFTIEGSGVAELSVGDHGITSKVLLSDSLHTPNLRSNLISVSKLVSKGARVSFEGDKAIVCNAEGTQIFAAMKRDGLYVVNVIRTLANAAQVRRKGVPYEIWHRRLGHIQVNMISHMVKGDLIDGLNAEGEAKLRALCEDCLFGKQTTHPFNNTVN
jgi:hypothetical protein